MESRKFFLFTFPVALLGLAVMVLISTGCEQSFEPIQENDRYFFSIYGYLDATADTQWVRLTPVRESLIKVPETLNAHITLEHLESGNNAVMHDSLFPFGDEFHFWNVWSDMELQPAQNYRITAEQQDGDKSSVSVELPQDFPTPLLKSEFSPDTLIINGVERLADVQTIWHIQIDFSGEKRVFSFSHLGDTIDTAPGVYELILNEDEDLNRILPRIDPDPETALEVITILDRQIFVASAGPGWLNFSGIDEEIIALPEGISNVENGVGYLVGIVSKTIPYRTCHNESNELVGCPLEQRIR